LLASPSPQQPACVLEVAAALSVQIVFPKRSFELLLQWGVHSEAVLNAADDIEQPVEACKLYMFCTTDGKVILGL
jgi:hypothetical protein